MIEFSHKPVLLEECMQGLALKSGGVYFDGTEGGGNHSFEILRRTFPDGRLIGTDLDDFAIAGLTPDPQLSNSYRSGYLTQSVGPGFRYAKDRSRFIANVYYQRIIEDYADTDAAASAQEELDAQNGGGKTDDSGEEDTDQKKEEADQETNGGSEE